MDANTYATSEKSKIVWVKFSFNQYGQPTWHFDGRSSINVHLSSTITLIFDLSGDSAPGYYLCGFSVSQNQTTILSCGSPYSEENWGIGMAMNQVSFSITDTIPPTGSEIILAVTLSVSNGTNTYQSSDPQITIKPTSDCPPRR